LDAWKAIMGIGIKLELGWLNVDGRTTVELFSFEPPARTPGRAVVGSTFSRSSDPSLLLTYNMPALTSGKVLVSGANGFIAVVSSSL
jgi:hypothetical protein